MVESRRRDKATAAFDKLFCQVGREILNPEFKSGETALYLYHYRSKGGVDFQFAPKFPVREKVDVKSLEEQGRKFPADFADREFVYEYFDNEFGFRIEFNPNKQDLREVSRILSALRVSGAGNWRFDVKVNRIDIPVDYYGVELDPSLIAVERCQKDNGFWTNDKFTGLYFGSMQSPLRFRVYDKVLERKREGVEIPGPLWRFELEYKEPFFLDEFRQKMLEAFDRVSFNVGGVQTDDPVLDLILFKARHFGLQVALSKFSRPTRAKYLERIEAMNFRVLEHPSAVFQSQFKHVWETLKMQILESFGYEVA